MARARNIKPGFFKNYELADLGPHAQLLFAGLWCLADREGRLEDKPRFIKAEVFPYYEVDINGELTELQRLKFLDRYMADGVAVIEIKNFKKHQTPHNTEKTSTLPPQPKNHAPSPCLETTSDISRSLTVGSRKYNGGNPPDSLIPDSRIKEATAPDSDESASIFTQGVELLKRTGTPESQARSFLGMYAKQDKSKLAGLIGTLLADPKIEPKAYIVRAMTPKVRGLVL